MPTDWPAAADVRKLQSECAVARIEQAISDDIASAFGTSFDRRRLLPYLQIHEFEALLFSDTDALANAIGEAKLAGKLRKIITAHGRPERIDRRDPPSKRLAAVFGGYDKVLHGTTVASRIGLSTIRSACPHFASWLAWLESLASASRTG